ncbi:MAG: hypothetical protein ACT7A5_30765 [Ferrovibrionaceae bacterium]
MAGQTPRDVDGKTIGTGTCGHAPAGLADAMLANLVPDRGIDMSLQR